MNIPLWSENNPGIKEILSSIDDTEWDDLTSEEKKLIWRHLQPYLFNPVTHDDNPDFNEISCNYKFYGKDRWENDHLAKIVAVSVDWLNDKYKRKSYARRFLKSKSFDDGCMDFHEIFIIESRDVVFELISIFSNVMVYKDKERLWKNQDEDNRVFEERKDKEKWKRFNKFSKEFNEVFGQFGINYRLTQNGLIAADEPEVIKKIYEPALKKLSSKKWAEVNRDLRDAFDALNKDKDGSGAITHALAALQAFLQIQIYGKTGKGDTAKLINEAINKNLIPDDDFSKKIIKDLNSFWAKERKEKGDPHPKKAYATKVQAKLIISLIMVFIDHAL